MSRKMLSLLLCLMILLVSGGVYAGPQAAPPEVYSNNSVGGIPASSCYLNEIFSMNIYIKNAQDFLSITLPIIYDNDKAVLLDKHGREVDDSTERDTVLEINPILQLVYNGQYPNFGIKTGFNRIALGSISNTGAAVDDEGTLMCTLYFRAKEVGTFKCSIGVKDESDPDALHDPTAPEGIIFYSPEGGAPKYHNLEYNFTDFEIKKGKSNPPEVVFILMDNTIAVGGLAPFAAVTLYDDDGTVIGSGVANEDGLFAIVNVDTSNGVNATQQEPYKDESDETAGVQGTYTRVLASIEPNDAITVAYGTAQTSITMPQKVKGKIGVEVSGYTGIFVFPEIVEMELDGIWSCPTYSGTSVKTHDFYVSPKVPDDVENKYDLKAKQQVIVQQQQTVIGGGGGGGGGGSVTTPTAPLVINCVHEATKNVIYTQKIEKITVGTDQVVNAPNLEGYVLAETEPRTKNIKIANSATSNVVEFIYVDTERKTNDSGNDRLRDDESPLLNYKDHYRYIIGYEDETIRPQREISREEVAAIFFRLLNEETRQENRTKIHPFPDVNIDRWSLGEIGTMSKLEIILGYPDGFFYPAKSITRAEFATVTMRFDVIIENATHGFIDISGHWAEDAIASAYQIGWVDGYEDGSFRPDQPITRTEAAKLINRVLKRRVDQIGIMQELIIDWPDLPVEHWGYYELMEATISHDYERRYSDRIMENWTGKGTDVNFSTDDIPTPSPDQLPAYIPSPSEIMNLNADWESEIEIVSQQALAKPEITVVLEAATEQTTPQPEYMTYTVQSGDTLFDLAAKYSIAVNDIKALNDLNSDIIRIGQTLKIKLN